VYIRRAGHCTGHELLWDYIFDGYSLQRAPGLYTKKGFRSDTQ